MDLSSGDETIQLSPPYKIGNELTVTAAALAHLNANGRSVQSVLKQHSSGDWGRVDCFTYWLNEITAPRGLLMLSVYQVGNHKVVVRSSAQHGYTLIRLDSEVDWYLLRNSPKPRTSPESRDAS